MVSHSFVGLLLNKINYISVKPPPTAPGRNAKTAREAAVIFVGYRTVDCVHLLIFVFSFLFSAKARLIKEGKSEIMALLYVGM